MRNSTKNQFFQLLTLIYHISKYRNANNSKSKGLAGFGKRMNLLFKAIAPIQYRQNYLNLSLSCPIRSVIYRNPIPKTNH